MFTARAVDSVIEGTTKVKVAAAKLVKVAVGGFQEALERMKINQYSMVLELVSDHIT